MSPEQLALIAIIAASTTLYITQWLSIEVTSVLTIGALIFTGILSPDSALSGFSNSATLTVAAMFVISAGLMRTGALEKVTIMLARHSNGSPRRLLALVAVVAIFSSAFMNNTPIVVMLLPVALSLSEQFDVRPSKLLLPIVFFATLGGTITLLGTSTNILVDGLYRDAGGPGFALFDFAPLGLIYSLLGSIYIVTIGYNLLPDRTPLAGLVNRRQHTTFITEIEVTPQSRLANATASDVFSRIARLSRPRPPTTRLRHRRLQRSQAGEEDPSAASQVELLEVFRNGQVFRAEEIGGLTLHPFDVLLVSGTPKAISRFISTNQASLATVLADAERTPLTDIEQKVVEAVVLPNSPCIGRLVGGLELNRQHGVKIMGVERQGRHRAVGIRNLRLGAGDVLLLQAKPGDLQEASEAYRLLLVEGVEESLLRPGKNWLALAVLAAVVTVASLTEIPIVALALLGAAILVIGRVLRVDEAYSSISTNTIMLLAGTIPIGRALETTGLAETTVNGILGLVGGASPVVFLSVFYLTTAIATELLSNNAVAVLLTPLALNLSMQTGINPDAMLVAVAFGASAGFMTPFGYQTNALVMGPGGYKFIDYLHVGLPLQLLCWVAATIFIPIFWPL